MKMSYKNANICTMHLMALDAFALRLLWMVLQLANTPFTLSWTRHAQTHKHTARRPEMWGSCRQKPGKAEEEAEGSGQTEGIIVDAHSCGLPCSKSISRTHDSIVAPE